MLTSQIKSIQVILLFLISGHNIKIKTGNLEFECESKRLTLCGTSKLQFFYAEILPELKKKNKPMSKTVNAICKKIKKVKNLFEISGIHISSWEFWVSVAVPDTLCFKLLGA